MRYWNPPVDTETLILEADAAVGLGGVEVVALVLKYGRLVELSLRKTLEKVTSRILEYFRLDNDQALDRRLNYLHG